MAATAKSGIALAENWRATSPGQPGATVSTLFSPGNIASDNRSPCAPWPTSSRDTLPTTSRFCANDTCKGISFPYFGESASARCGGAHPLKIHKGPALSEVEGGSELWQTT